MIFNRAIQYTVIYKIIEGDIIPFYFIYFSNNKICNDENMWES